MRPFQPEVLHWKPIQTLLAAGLPQAMLAVGQAGTLVGRYVDILQAAALCFSPSTDGFACGECRSCHLLAEQSHPDFLMVSAEPGKKIAIDQVRQATEFLSYTPQVSARRWLRLEPGEAMTGAAANALLKTLEEPASSAHILLLSEQPSRLLPTVRSRLQRLPFPKEGAEETVQWLKAQGLDDGAACLLARQFSGRPVRALASWQSGWADQRAEWMRTLLELPEKGPIAALRIADSWSKADIVLLREFILSLLSDLIRLRYGHLDKMVHVDYLDELRPVAVLADVDGLFRELEVWLRLPEAMAGNVNLVMVLEKQLLDWIAIWRREKNHGAQT